MGKMFARQEDICDSQQAVRRSTRCLMDNLHKLSLDVLDTPDDYLMNGWDNDGIDGGDDVDDVVEEEVPPDDDA
ncbi:hypothetical protein DEO72_LG5g2007 [Vigna unguiculata]|uniref:Uncharacterized protein n=1 Tax=Vigna unguiculata TaxID=3917 RepID=A0A4D6LZB7_VIGUN|nr:hypothetical protein DEO72_LG5g2007 [Vigna unguiculata]